MMRCKVCISLRLDSGWLVIYASICSCTFIVCGWLSIFAPFTASLRSKPLFEKYLSVSEGILMFNSLGRSKNPTLILPRKRARKPNGRNMFRPYVGILLKMKHHYCVHFILTPRLLKRSPTLLGRFDKTNTGHRW